MQSSAAASAASAASTAAAAAAAAAASTTAAAAAAATTSDADDAISIDLSIAASSFLTQPADRSLRITCYGSSAAQTPEAYLKEARSLGYILAKRGHICVNGAGSFGCMAAMNDGAVAGNGHIVGVIHEMFLVDDGYKNSKTATSNASNASNVKEGRRDGGAHRAFDAASATPFDERTGPIREILVATGKDLQQRKKLLVEKTEGLIVLPGGPGTWDELWEMSCARHLGLTDLPIVCVNVDDYYAPFQDMLDRAFADNLIKLPPHQIVHFADSAEEAVRWIEATKAGTMPTSTTASNTSTSNKRASRRVSTLKQSSFFSPLMESFSFGNNSSGDAVNTNGDGHGTSSLQWAKLGMTFLTGVACGVVGATVATISIAKRRR